jgi:hypothetical protein
MQSIPKIFKPAQTEVNSAAHDQDLIEIPKRARLDREAEAQKLDLPEYEDKQPESAI